MIPVPHIYVHCSSKGHAIRDDTIDDPSSTMDFERCKDSVSASIIDDIVDDIVTCDRGQLI